MVQIAGVGSTISGINFLATILKMRCPGMTLRRMPMFVWVMFVDNWLILLVFPPLAAAQMMLMIDRLTGANFFNPSAGGNVLLWQHIFWVFGHPEVYVLIFPIFAAMSEIVPVFSRKPIFGKPAMVAAIVMIGVFLREEVHRRSRRIDWAGALLLLLAFGSLMLAMVQSGTLGVVVAILAVLTYLWFRFEWQFAVGAIIGTMHDLLLTVGFFCVTQLEFNQTSIAAILTIVGYSLNETVVVLDRIREVMRKYKRLSTAEIIDMSVNAVLPRTIMTATTVFLALLALFFLGGHVIRSFSAAMIWGIFVATYSSIFICSPMLTIWACGPRPSTGCGKRKPRARM